MGVDRGGQPRKWQKMKRKLQKSFHLLRVQLRNWNFIRECVVLAPKYWESCQAPWRSRTDYDCDATKMPGSPFTRLLRSGHTKTIPIPEQLDFEPSVLGTQPIVRLARRWPLRQTEGLPTAKQAVPSLPPRAAWVLLQPVTYGIKI